MFLSSDFLWFVKWSKSWREFIWQRCLRVLPLQKLQELVVSCLVHSASQTNLVLVDITRETERGVNAIDTTGIPENATHYTIILPPLLCVNGMINCEVVGNPGLQASIANLATSAQCYLHAHARKY